MSMRTSHKVLDQGSGGDVQRVPLVVPTPRQLRAAAVWVTIANWADGLAARYGGAHIVTPAGRMHARDARGIGADVATAQPSRVRSRTEVHARTLLTDARRALWGAQFCRAISSEVTLVPPLVWQHHDLFQFAGFRLARTHNVPVVLFLDAPQVWEARAWGVTRPGWGRLLEGVAEAPQLRRADVVACVSDEVRDAACSLGARPERTVVTPCTAPTSLPQTNRKQVRAELAVDDAFVIGWVGSFRRFHGLDILVEAARGLTDDLGRVTLLLVGDGAEREHIAARCATHGINARFTGSVGHDDVFRYMSAFDCGVVTAAPGVRFHYSPLKLKEYLAAGVPVLAPAVGEMVRVLKHGATALLYGRADSAGLASQLSRLARSARLRDELAANGRTLSDERFSIAAQIAAVETVLAGRS